MKCVLLLLCLLLVMAGSAHPAQAYPVDVISETPREVILLMWSDSVPTVTVEQGSASRVFGGPGMYKYTYLVALYGMCPVAAIETRRGGTFYLTVYSRPCVYLPMVSK